jgi:uncharacterized membrane protein YfcA
VSPEILLGAVFLGAIVQGFTGFAFSAVAGAILLQVAPANVTVPLLMLCSLAIQGFVLVRLRGTISWQASLPYLVGGAGGVLLAAGLFDLIDVHTFRIAFGGFLVLYASWMLMRPQVALLLQKRRPLGHAAVGFAGGLIGGLTAMPGAVLAIWCDVQAMPKTAQRGVVQPFIAAMQTLALAFLFLKAPAVYQAMWPQLLIALPALLAGSMVGLYLFGKVKDAAFRKVVCGLLLLSGIAMLR